MELKIRKNGEIYIIDVNGEMDLYNSYKLKELGKVIVEFDDYYTAYVVDTENGSIDFEHPICKPHEEGTY